MLSKLFRILTAVTSCLTCLYGIYIFGISFWPLTVIAISLVIAASVFFERLNPAAKALGILLGILSLAAFLLLLIAANIGGSFHLSESNQVIAICLFFIALFGLTAFFWPDSKQQEQNIKQT